MIKKKDYKLEGSEGKPMMLDLTFDDQITDSPVIIFVHGFKGFKDWGAHHLIANHFAINGYRYLKFNLSHSGVGIEKPYNITDLEAFAANTFSKELFDLELVINFAVKDLGAKKLFLVGHSRGGGLSIIKAVENPHVKGLITWSAISEFSSLWKAEQETGWKMDGKIYVENARTKEKMPLNVTLLKDFESNRERLNILENARQINIPWLIIQGDEDVNVPFENAQKLAKVNPISKLVRIAGANHVYGASHPYINKTLPPHLLQVCEESLKFLNGVV